MNHIIKNFNFKSELRDGELRVFFNGDIDHHVLTSVKNQIDENICSAHPRKLVLDLFDVNFADSSVLGFVMGRYVLMQRLGGEICIAEPNDRLIKIFNLVGLDRIIKIEKTEKACKHSTPSRKTGRIAGAKPSENVISELKIKLPSLSVNEGVARDLCATFCSQLDVTEDGIADIKCVVSEAVTNCVVHAYRDGTGKIDIMVRLYDNGIVRIDVRDCGCGIENVALAREPLYTTDAFNENSGMGFTVMEYFSDKLKVTSKPNKGTSVSIYKWI